MIYIVNIYKTKGIYGIRNMTNNKIYVGKTQVSFGDRWDDHKSKLRNNYHDNPYLQRSWNKYGESNFEFLIIEQIDSNDNNVFNQREIFWIQYYKSKGLAYNISNGGDGAPGVSLSDESRRIIGEKNRQNMLGRKLNLKTRIKMSESHKQRQIPESQILQVTRLGKSHKGKPKSEEIKRRISETLKKNPTTRKYSDEQIIEVRIRNEILHQKNGEIAKIMNMPDNYVSAIKKYKRWPDLKPTYEQIKLFLNTHT